MSITFIIPDAPRTTVPCEWCEKARTDLREDPEYARAALNGKWVEEGQVVSDEELSQVRCDPWCRGEHEESIAPEINLANANATSLLRLLGLPTDCFGEVEVTTLLQRIMVASNTDRSHETAEPYDLPAGHAGTRIVDVDGMPTIQRMGPRVIGGGRSDAYLVDRLGHLRNLAEWATTHGHSTITWG